MWIYTWMTCILILVVVKIWIRSSDSSKGVNLKKQVENYLENPIESL